MTAATAASVAACCIASAVLVAPLRRWSVRVLPVCAPVPPKPVPVVEIAATLELLALGMRSGCGIVEALDLVGAELDDVAGAHLRAVAAALRWGLTEEDAWSVVPGAWEPAAQALALAAGAGVPPAELLLAAAEDIRRREDHRLETAAAKLAVRVVLPLGLTFLPAFFLMAVFPFVIALSGSLFDL